MYSDGSFQEKIVQCLADVPRLLSWEVRYGLELGSGLKSGLGLVLGLAFCSVLRGRTTTAFVGNKIWVSVKVRVRVRVKVRVI